MKDLNLYFKEFCKLTIIIHNAIPQPDQHKRFYGLNKPAKKLINASKNMDTASMEDECNDLLRNAIDFSWIVLFFHLI